MKIKNIRSFREAVWETQTYSDPHYDIDFIGVANTEAKKHGFFKMFHGISRVEDSIVGMLKIADDEQAIYELLQNASDCDAKIFELHYNDRFLIAFNNGNPFTQNDVISILNESYSNKREGQIGRFGVGFKIVHKLVGSNQGKTELIDEKKGPIIFSWNNSQSLKELLYSNPETTFEYDELDSISPWLFKILITNFPIAPYESNIRDIDYVTVSNDFFKKEDFKNFISYLKTIQLDESSEKGTIIFLDLGEGKQGILDKEKEKVKDGIAYSLNFLKKSVQENELKRIIINERQNPIKIEKLEIEPVTITIKQSNLFVDDKLKEQDVSEVKFAYLRGDDKAILKDYPNLYKYFPLSEQKLGFNFILHSEIFEIDKNRLKIEYNPKNEKLLEYFIESFSKTIETIAENDISKYRDIFLAIYLSDDKPTNDHIFRSFYKSIKGLIKGHIPTKGNGFDKAENIVSNSSRIDFELADWGIKNKKWFYWNSTDYKKINEAKYREINSIYTITEWNLSTCINNAAIESFNNWFALLSADAQNNFLRELDSTDLKDVSKINQFKLFKFSDNKFYSANENTSRIEEADSKVKPKNLVFHSTKTFTVKTELEKLEQLTSEIDIEKNYPKLFTLLGLNLKQANLLKEVIIKTHTIELDSQEKKNVFLAFPELKSEEYFKNGFNKIQKLTNLLKPNKDYPSWLSKYSILDTEHFEELDAYLVKNDNELFSFIHKNWASIILLEEVKKNAKEFYNTVESYYASSDKTLSLKNLPIVFVNETIGFVKSTDVYFHNTLTDCNYLRIQNAIKTIFELEIPHEDALVFLSKEDGVFQINDDKSLLSRTINPKTSIELGKEDVIEFLNFSISKIHEEFFEHFIITEKAKDVYVIESKAQDIFQVSQIKREVINLILKTENLSKKYKILPNNLKDDFGDSKGVLNWKNNFYTSLLKDKELLAQPAEIFKYLFDPTSQREYINAQTEILIPLNLDIDVDGSIYKTLEWCLGTDEQKGVFANDEIPLVRGKFKLHISDEKYEVAKSGGEMLMGAKISFSLHDLLPWEPHDKKNEYTSNFLKQYSAKGLKEESLKLFFGIDEDLTAAEIYDKMLMNNVDTLNSRQIEFLLLYSAENTKVDLTAFSVESCLKRENLAQRFYTNPISFIKPSHILSSKYSDIEIKYCSNKILSVYTLTEDNVLDTSLFKGELNDEDKIALLEFIFGVWKADIENFENYNISGAYGKIGFDKFSKILNGSYAVPEETLPEFYEQFLGNDEEKELFSIAFGIYGDDSLVVKFRKYFENITPENIFENIESIDYKFIANTLRWLCTNEKVLCNKFHLESIALIYGLKLPIEHNLYLYLSSIDSQSNLCFIIQEAGSEDYYIDDLALKKLSVYEIPPNEIFQLILNAKKHLIIRNTYPENFVFNENFKPIQIPESINSVDELQNLTVWNEPYYLAWKRENDLAPDIFRFDGEIPRFIIFENKPFKLQPSGLHFTENGKYYVSQNAIDVLEALRIDLATDTYDSLINFKIKFELPPPPNHNEDEERAEEQFENPFKDITPDDESFIRGIIKEDFELNEKLDANKTAKIKTLMAIKGQYSAAQISDEGRFLKAGTDEIIVRSAQKGLLYLDLFHWERLNEDKVKIAVYTNSQINIFNSQEDLFQFCKPQNTFGVLRMPNDYNLDDYNNLDYIKEKSKWHFVFIVNKDAKDAKIYKEFIDYSDPNLFDGDNF